MEKKTKKATIVAKKKSVNVVNAKKADVGKTKSGNVAKDVAKKSPLTELSVNRLKAPTAAKSGFLPKNATSKNTAIKTPAKKNQGKEIEEVKFAPLKCRFDITKQKQHYMDRLCKEYKLRDRQTFEIGATIDPSSNDHIILSAFSTKLDGTLTQDDLFFDLK